MGFFFTGTSKAPAVRASKALPTAALNAAGCTACPRNTDRSLENPKLEPIGKGKRVVILTSSRTREEDLEGEWLSTDAESSIASGLGRALFPRECSVMSITRCAIGSATSQEIECCRGHITGWIEERAPKLVIAVGDAALSWCVPEFTSVSKWRGRYMPAKIGKHVCWVLPVLDPQVLESKRRGKNWTTEYDTTFKYDLRMVEDFAFDGPDAVVEDSALDAGIEIIDGSSPGDLERLRRALRSLQSYEVVGLDLETTGLRPYATDSKILTMSVGTRERVVAFPIDHPRGWKSTELPEVHACVSEWLLNSPKKACHNVGFEMEWLAYFYGREILRRTEWEDTHAQAYALDERPGTHSLENLVLFRFGFNVKKLGGVDAAKALSYPLQELLRYNGLDSKWCHALFEVQRSEIERVPAYGREYDRLMRLAPTLVLTQLQGVPVDEEEAARQDRVLSGTIEKSLRLISRCPEVDKFTRQFGTFNPSSPDHVVKLLHDICKRPEVYSNGRVSSDESVLSSIPKEEMLSASLILDLREAEKLRSTYVLPILERKIVYDDGCMHTVYNAKATVTGRLSSDSPNTQNFPKRKNKQVRRIVQVLEGSIASLDYGQIEARVIAMASQDKALVKALWADYDIHAFWGERFVEAYAPLYEQIASEFGIDVGETKHVMKQVRQEAKNKWVFPQFFGSSPVSCAKSLNIPKDVAFKIADEFWDEFKGVKKWQEKLIAKWERNLYVETLTGRRRRGPMSRNEIINTPVQGTAADIVTTAMSALSEYADSTGQWQYQPVMNIHDDLTFILSEATRDQDLERISMMMVEPRYDFINVPLVVEVSVGKSWDDLTEIAKVRSNA